MIANLESLNACAVVLQVVLHPSFGAPPLSIMLWTWLCLLLASAGLVLLHKTTTADPGFLPRRDLESREKDKDKVCCSVLRSSCFADVCDICKPTLDTSAALRGSSDAELRTVPRQKG